MTLALQLSPQRFKELFPNASTSLLAANGIAQPRRVTGADFEAVRAVPHAQPEHHETTTLGATVQGETEGVRRIRVSFTLYRVRLLDDDNAAGSVKDLLDGLRRAALIPDDSRGHIKLETEQVRVPSFKDERTEIEIFW